MKKNKWISVAVALLLVVSTVVVFNFGDGNIAAKVLDQNTGAVYASEEADEDELKPEMNFVSGSAGVDATELKAEADAQNTDYDFIVTAIGNYINSPAKQTSGGNVTPVSAGDVAVPAETAETPDMNTVPETKPGETVDPEEIPFDIANPEAFESGEVEYADNQILIKFKKSFDGRVDKELKNAGIGKLEPMFSVESGDWYLAYILKDADVNDTMDAVRALDKVVVAEYNFKSEPASIDTDPLSDTVTANEMADQQWVLKSCGIQASWDYLEENGINPGGSSSVVVAVIDTGVDYNHADLKNNIWINTKEIPDNGRDDDNNGYVDDYYGVDIISGNGSGMDDHGHGTHVAGIIAAENNDIGVVGIAYNTKIMPVKAGSASGVFLSSDIANAIIYAFGNGADVINMSFGGGASSVAERDALEDAYSRCVLVAAAGNSSSPNESTDYYPIPLPSYPGNYKFVLGVMSSDRNDIESGFTNWDAYRFNNNEYEVYAPGNEILSTIPGDRYASLSGTSMASPVVAAQAALLRSMFNDPDTYPTKFIYGQISGTSENTISCCNPQRHTVGGSLHNIPGRVNFENSFKNLPRPELSVSDYTIFDTQGFVNDTEGIAAEAAEVNNGDGILDSGEVVALGFTLRNRWGMSKDTVVSINATNELGVTNPYVTILNNDVNYGSVGTYSEQDAGRITDNDQWTGWDHPFYLKIADNCPNDYTITLNATIESKNALDESDTAIYRGEASIMLVVRNGVILSNKITEDMTLTSDNYYIIPNSTIIMEGATVTVEPGTKIQFWTNDPQDAYADVAITYLKVEGQFLCKGTEEEPVEIFPSDWMGQYRVEIYKSNNGFVSLSHTKLTNPYLDIDKADYCTFTQTYPNDLVYYRYLNGGRVNWNGDWGRIIIADATNSAFYKLSYCEVQEGSYRNCIFVDSAITSNRQNMFNNCVFYGNNSMADGSTGDSVSSIYAYNDNYSVENERIVYDDYNDKYYISLSDAFKRNRIDYSAQYAPNRIATFDLFAKQMGGTIASINTDDEYSLIVNRFQMDDNIDYWFGIHRTENYNALNYDNTEVPSIIPIEKGGMYYAPLNNGVILFTSNNYYQYTNRYLLEIPGNGLATDITLDKYIVNLETGGTHQIEAAIKPVTVTQTDLKYLSDDESIATVEDNGEITAVAPGTTQIKVYSQDMAIYNYVTVNVTDYVAIESLGVAEDELQINIGDTKKIKPVFTPSNTTRTAVTYESSDESIASVSAKGIVTANSEGDATITLTGEGGLTATVTVHSVIPVESIAFSRDFHETNIEEGIDDTVVTEPEILPLNATNKTLIWESTDPDICTVTDGQLVKNSTGIVTLRATVENTDLSDEITVIITDNSINPTAVKTVKSDGTYVYAITEAGEIYVWGNGITRPTRMVFANVEDAYLNYWEGYVYILDKNGIVSRYQWSIDDPVKDDTFVLRDIRSLSSSNYVVNSYHAIDNSGTVWAWGQNTYGRLGDGSESYRGTPVQIYFDNEIVKILDLGNYTVFLDSDNNMFVCGCYDARMKSPVLKASMVSDIYSSGTQNVACYESGERYTRINPSSGNGDWNVDKEHPSEKGVGMGHSFEFHWYYGEDNVPYVYGYGSNGRLGIGDSSNSNIDRFTPMVGVSDVKDVIAFEFNSTFVITNDGRLYGTGYNYKGELGILHKENVSVPAPIEFLSEDYSTETLNMTNWSLSADGIEVIFNYAPNAADDFSMITLVDGDGNNVSISKTIDMNRLTIKPKTRFTNGSSYTLTIPQTALKTKLNGTMNEDIVLTFVYTGDYSGDESGIDPDPSGGDEEIPDDGNEETTDDGEVIHELVTDEELLAQRDTVTSGSLSAAWEEFCGLNINSRFYSNVILNRLNNDNTSTWLRITTHDSSSYETISLGQNYWGTTNEVLIDKQILDFDDYQSLADLDETNYLTEAPSDTFPFVTGAYLTVNGEQTDTVGNEEVTFVVTFNRPMDTSIDLDVKFGSSYPYAEYTIPGEYVSDTEWHGTTTLTTLIENGYQYFSVSNGKAKDTSLQLYKDWGRFPFRIDTAAAQSLLMQGTATEEGIYLTWTQDDFETLAGYNVYRSELEDGQYNRVNKTVIPADTKEFLDDTVEPGVKYYYNFTVVQTDMTESEPSGKVEITALDTMAPNIYHTPVTIAYKGSNLVISATIIDNVGIQNATLYYRVAGTEEWKSRTMDRNNDKYSAVVNTSFLTDAGLEYYIDAFDGVEHKLEGSADEPFFVVVQEPVSAGDLGDVDGNGTVELRDAMLLLMAVNDRYNMPEDEFRRADLDGNGELSAKEALKIIYYINGTITSLIS